MKKIAMIVLTALATASAATVGGENLNDWPQVKKTSLTSSPQKVVASDVVGEDMTSLITNPSFENNNADGWNGSTPQFQSYRNAEFFNTTFDFYQSLSGLKNGVYKVSVKGFYRAGSQAAAADSYHNTAHDYNLYANVYAKTASGVRMTPMQSICTGETDISLGAETIENGYGYVPNSMESANIYCEAGHYKENVVYCKVTDGNLTIGIRKNGSIDTDWTLFDDWQLFYLGEDVELPIDANTEQMQFAVSSNSTPVSFKNDNSYPWTVEGNTIALHGNDQSNYYAASWLTMSFSSQNRTELSFEWARYDYGYHDALQVYIDGVYQSSTSNSSYTSQRFYLDAGAHVVTFRDSVSYYNYKNNWSVIRNIKVNEILPLETVLLTDKSQPLKFTNDGLSPWITEDGYIEHQNFYKQRTGASFSTTFTIEKTSKLSFDYKVANYNYTNDYNYERSHNLFVYINGIQISKSWNNINDTYWCVALEPGEYTVEWKDTVYNDYSDWINYYSQIKNIELSNNWITCELATAGTLGVEALYQVNVLNDVEMLKVVGPMNSSDWTDIKNMTNLKALDLSEAVLTEIPNNALDGKGWINSVILPEGITRIGEYAFRGTNIRCIDIPSTVKTIAQYAFYGTPIQYANFAAGSQCTTIANDAFYNCYSLQSIDFGDDSPLTTIGYGAFKNCSSLKEIILPSSVTSVGSAAFQYCTSLKAMYFSDAITDIAVCVCDGCTSLTDLKLPKNATIIRFASFNNTPSLRHIDLPETLNDIYYRAFDGCGVDSIMLPVHLQNLSEEAFRYCNNLKYIEMPSCLNGGTYSYHYYVNDNGSTSSTTWGNFGYYGNFYNCPAIEKVVMRAAAPPTISRDPFDQSRAKNAITLKVPSFAVVNYKLDTYWYQFGSIVEGDDVDYWRIANSLSLTNNRRMNGKPDIDLYYGGQFTVGGNAPMETGLFNLYVSESSPGRLLNTCETMTADSINSYFSVESEKWYFITPLHDVDLTKVTVSNSASYVFRYYDGSSRATNGTGNSWRNVDNGKLTAGQGYIFRCNANAVVTFPAEASVHAQVFNTDDVTIALNAFEAAASANKSWNFVGNPYPCYYDIYYMDFTAPITVWTGSTYKAYSIVDDSYALRPMQSFFVQKPDAVDDIIFHKEGRQLTADINHGSLARAFRTPSNVTALSRRFFNLQMIGDEMEDETRLVINDNASLEYEIERDASKFMSFEPNVPQIFTLDGDGNGYAINERPLGEGTVKLAYYAGQSGFYTLSATRADGDIYLYDAQLNKTVNLMEQDYTFHSDATEGTNNSRFILSLNVSGSDITGVKPLESIQPEESDYYDLLGRKVESTSKKGIYIHKGRKVVK